MTRSLYTIQAELDTIISVAEEMIEGGLVDPSICNTAIDGWLEANRDEIKEKIDNYCGVIANKTAMAEARKKEAQALTRMAQADERVAAMLKDRALAFFERVGIEKMETLHFKPRVQQNGGKLPVILAADVESHPELLPVEYQRISVSANVEAVRDALENGAELPFAELGERGRHFRVR